MLEMIFTILFFSYVLYGFGYGFNEINKTDQPGFVIILYCLFWPFAKGFNDSEFENLTLKLYDKVQEINSHKENTDETENE